MPDFDAIVNLPGITVLGAQAGNPFIIHGTYDGPVNCPKCGAKKLRKKAKVIRKVKHQPCNAPV